MPDPRKPALSLAEELELAVERAVVGEALRAGLAGRAYTAAQGVLVRRGVRGAKISVRPEGAGLVVEVLVPAGPRVERIVVGVGVL